MYKSHERSLEALARRGRRRALTSFSGADFTSNDYLGLASSAELKAAARAALERDVPIGSGGSRLLRGNTRARGAGIGGRRFLRCRKRAVLRRRLHRQPSPVLDVAAARRRRRARCAHPRLGPRRHAYGQSRARRGPPQRRASFRGRSSSGWRVAGGTGRPGSRWRASTAWTVTAHRSMISLAIANRHEGMLIIDEAHATGVLGPLGTRARRPPRRTRNVIALQTCGKALGVMGASARGPQRDARFSRQSLPRRSSSATAPSPLMARARRAPR